MPVQLLVIAGPAGAGKSTFMRELAEGRLDPPIAKMLPSGAETWPRLAANDLDSRGWGLGLQRLKVASLVVHYNTMRPFSRGFGDYASDPALKLLGGAGASVTVATLIPEPELLLKQYRARLVQRNEDEWWVKASPLKVIRRRVRIFLRGRLKRTQQPLKLDQLRLIRLYETPDELGRWYELWRSHLERMRQQRPDTKLLFVAPRSTSGDRATFELLRSRRSP